jgi:hypothetical protein
MRILVCLACCAYWLFLTALLLDPNPAPLVGLDEVPLFPWGDFGIHLIAFAGLGFLTNATRWPKRPCWSLTGLLAVYAVATELTQLLIPGRCAELLDVFENILGIAAGSAGYWLLVRLVCRRRDRTVAAGWLPCAGEEGAPAE